MSQSQVSSPGLPAPEEPLASVARDSWNYIVVILLYVCVYYDFWVISDQNFMETLSS